MIFVYLFLFLQLIRSANSRQRVCNPSRRRAESGGVATSHRDASIATCRPYGGTYRSRRRASRAHSRHSKGTTTTTTNASTTQVAHSTKRRFAFNFGKRENGKIVPAQDAATVDSRATIATRTTPTTASCIAGFGTKDHRAVSAPRATTAAATAIARPHQVPN